MAKNPEVVVRAIEKSDVESAQKFLLQNLKDLYNIESDYPNNWDIWAMEEVYLGTSNNTILGAFAQDGRIVGTIAVRPYDDRIGAVKCRYDVRNTADLGRCYIEKDLRRKGIGSLLVQSIFQFCQQAGYKMIYLHTHKFLPGGFQFWQAQGFQITVDECDVDQTVHMEKIL